MRFRRKGKNYSRNGGYMKKLSESERLSKLAKEHYKKQLKNCEGNVKISKLRPVLVSAKVQNDYLKLNPEKPLSVMYREQIEREVRESMGFTPICKSEQKRLNSQCLHETKKTKKQLSFLKEIESEEFAQNWEKHKDLIRIMNLSLKKKALELFEAKLTLLESQLSQNLPISAAELKDLKILRKSCFSDRFGTGSFMLFSKNSPKSYENKKHVLAVNFPNRIVNLLCYSADFCLMVKQSRLMAPVQTRIAALNVRKLKEFTPETFNQLPKEVAYPLINLIEVMNTILESPLISSDFKPSEKSEIAAINKAKKCGKESSALITKDYKNSPKIMQFLTREIKGSVIAHGVDLPCEFDLRIQKIMEKTKEIAAEKKELKQKEKAIEKKRQKIVIDPNFKSVKA